MKTIQQLTTEINRTTESGLQDTGRTRTAAGKRTVFLRLCLKYLESGATGEFVAKEVERVVRRLVLIEADYPKWIAPQNYGIKERRDAYDRMFGVAELRAQLKTLEYILE